MNYRKLGNLIYRKFYRNIFRMNEKIDTDTLPTGNLSIDNIIENILIY
jgi:hypothetical protein